MLNAWHFRAIAKLVLFCLYSQSKACKAFLLHWSEHVLLSEPGRTDYDINFEMFGIPVRVHPAFFILPVLLGRGMIDSEMNVGVGMLLVAALFFVSILIHELGHVFAYRYFGQAGRIVLYWMGGIAIADSGNLPWARTSVRRFTGNQQIIISLAGPAAGLSVAAVCVALVYAFGGTVRMGWIFGFVPIPFAIMTDTVMEGNRIFAMLIQGGIIWNILINLLNLLPVYPLDGGQVSRELFLKFDPWNGISTACCCPLSQLSRSQSWVCLAKIDSSPSSLVLWRGKTIKLGSKQAAREDLGNVFQKCFLGH